MVYLSGADLPRLSWKKAVKHIMYCNGADRTLGQVSVQTVTSKQNDILTYRFDVPAHILVVYTLSLLVEVVVQSSKSQDENVAKVASAT